ncbi:hypothetical protein BH11PSE12_BH11PSE12_06220 [soil metagenome]
MEAPSDVAHQAWMYMCMSEGHACGVLWIELPEPCR